jgi:murein DD-endopeptidase MepM/ murein hydrolase activator NlpD
MSADGIDVRIGGAAPGGDTAGVASQSLDREKVRQLAQQFEALLMTQMLRDMRRSMVDGEDDQSNVGGMGQNGLTDTIDVELGLALSRAGGFGLTSSLLGAFERSAGVSPAPSLGESPAAPMSMPAPAASTTGETGLSALQAGRISSAYGWRQDPLNGAPRFHAGVDIALPTGSDVVAADAGRVVFSGAQGDFGNTILIDHGGGRQTRYAHLSGETVGVGDVVAAGQVIGKSGATGRVTGPHLHFEVLLNGKAVNPLGLAAD